MLESSQDDPVHGFGLPVGLGVLDRGKMLLSGELGNEVLETLVGELCAIVCDEHSWYPKSSEHVSFVKMEDVVQGDFR